VIIIWGLWSQRKKFTKLRQEPTAQIVVYTGVTSLLLLASNFQTLLYHYNNSLGRYSLPVLVLTGIVFAITTQNKKPKVVVLLGLYLVLSSAIFFWYCLLPANTHVRCVEVWLAVCPSVLTVRCCYVDIVLFSRNRVSATPGCKKKLFFCGKNRNRWVLLTSLC
jgi:hypothetical protein